MLRHLLLTAAAAAAFSLANPALPAAADSKEAKVEREKPLQRCDQLADKAQFDCLAKARDSVAQARKKREEKTVPAK